MHRFSHGDRCLQRAYLRRVLVHMWECLRRASDLGTRRTRSTQQVSAATYYKRCSIFVYVASATEILHFVNPSLSWGVVKVVAFGLASHAEDL